MRFIDEYKRLIEQLMKSNITFKMNMEKDLVEISGSIYVYVEEGWEDEAETYSVGFGLREKAFDLDEIDKVISFIKDELDWQKKQEEGV